jgi:hypothetical protein
LDRMGNARFVAAIGPAMESGCAGQTGSCELSGSWVATYGAFSIRIWIPIAPDKPRASARNRRLKASDRLGLPTAGTGRCPFPDPLLFTLASFQPVALQPLSRRRPLSSTGTGAVCNELHGVGRYLAAAGPCDAVTDIRAMSKTVKWRLPTSSSGASSSSRPS